MAAEDAPTTEIPEVSADKSGKMKLIMIIVGIMVIEAIAFKVISGGSSASAEENGEAADVDTNLVEVMIDKMSCTNKRADPGSGLHIQMEMAALVEEDQQVTFSEAVSKTHKARIREAILKVLLSANLEELNDPQQSSMKRRIREEMNKVLRKSVVVEVAISDFSTLEQ